MYARYSSSLLPACIGTAPHRRILAGADFSSRCRILLLPHLPLLSGRSRGQPLPPPPPPPRTPPLATEVVPSRRSRGLPHRLRLEPRSSPSAAAATFHRCPRRRRSHGLPQRHARSSGLPTLLSSRQHHHCVHRARSSLATTDAGAGPVLRGESMELGHIPTSWPPLHHYHGARWPLYRRALRCEADLASSTKRPLSAPRPRPLPQAHPCLPDDHLHHQHSMECMNVSM